MTQSIKNIIFIFIMLLQITGCAATLSMLPSITFHGRVIDQYGQPVRNAQVWYESTNTYLSSGGGIGKVTTDAQGYIEINASGAALVLGRIVHPEIDIPSYPPPAFNNTSLDQMHYGQVTFLNSEDKQGLYGTWKNHTNKDKAYIVNVWRLGKHQDAKKGRIRAGLSADGQIYTIILNETNKRKMLIKGKKKGDFYISCKRAHIKSYKERPDWSISLIPVNGGIQETDDLYMNLAPETDYQSKLKIVMDRDNKNYKRKLLNKRYYFVTNNKNNYGNLFIHFVPLVSIESDVCSINIIYTSTLSGSRNLEIRR